MSKAFDKLNEYILLKLMNRKCPLKFINLLYISFSISCSIIKWGECHSKMMFPTTGVKQGSILSTFIFSVYVDDMLNCLHYSQLGCQIKYTSLMLSCTLTILYLCQSQFLVYRKCRIFVPMNFVKLTCVLTHLNPHV